MSLQRLLFNTAAVADGPTVGSYLLDSAGALLTSTLVGSDQALDVNLVQSVALAVSATDLDIRDLTHVSDSVKIGDGTDFLAIAADGSIAVTDNGASLTVDATQLDIDDLNATDDAVQAWVRDGAGNAITSTTGFLDVNIAASAIELDVEDDLADIAISVAAETVTTTSGALITSPLANRRFVFIANVGDKNIEIGPSGVAYGSGYPIPKNYALEGLRIGPAVAIHADAESGSQDVRVMQLS